jgi:hypothetical protein
MRAPFFLVLSVGFRALPSNYGPPALALCESAATIARRRTMRRIVQGAN